MFRGNNEINMDAKGRMAIPVRYRDSLASLCEGRLIVTIDIHDQCLLLYPLPEWEKIETQIARLPTFNPASRKLQRLLIGHARELELDGSGRILIPPELRKHAQIDKKVMLVGQSHRLELWSEECWEIQREAWLTETADEEAIPDEMLTLSL